MKHTIYFEQGVEPEISEEVIDGYLQVTINGSLEQGTPEDWEAWPPTPYIISLTKKNMEIANHRLGITETDIKNADDATRKEYAVEIKRDIIAMEKQIEMDFHEDKVKRAKLNKAMKLQKLLLEMCNERGT